MNSKNVTELIKFIKENKNKHRFTIYTNCEKGYSFEGITLSPYWKWRTGNKYNNCLVYADPSHLMLNINVKTVDTPLMSNFQVIFVQNVGLHIGNVENVDF